MSSTFLLLIFVGAAALYWQDALRSRERVLRKCKQVCKDADVQLLDQTVQVIKIRLTRGFDGRVRFKRWYEYEFSTDGMNRCFGLVVMVGSRPEILQMTMPDGTTLTY